MVEDAEGFFYPHVNEPLCISCGRCVAVCPSLNISSSRQSHENSPRCFAIAAADSNLRINSSSGGVFTLLAQIILRDRGAVVGVAYNGEGKAQHIIVDNERDLHLLRGSKYVQADTNNIYWQVMKILEKGQKVLFSGSPCQVAGLYTFLSKANIDNLYTIDLVCHGVPSQKTFDLSMRDQGGDFINANFRDKTYGWTSYLITETSKGIIGNFGDKSGYLKAFYADMSTRPSCSKCPWVGSKREGNITLGDFWKIGDWKPQLNDNGGTSLVLVNDKKGEGLLGSVKREQFLFAEEVPLEYALQSSTTLGGRTFPAHPNRQAFFRKLNQGVTVNRAASYTERNTYDCAIIGIWPNGNYGAACTVYALQEAIRSLSYKPAVIHWIPRSEESEPSEQWTYAGSFVERFAKRYLELTQKVKTFDDFIRLNDLTQTFISGSDCLFHPDFFNRRSRMYPNFLSFADADAKRIAYATSFGTYDFDLYKDERERMHFYMSQYDRISVREKAGIEFCQENFKLKVEQNVDPVFLLPPEFWGNLANKSKVKEEKPFIFSYNFRSYDHIHKFKNFIQQICKKIGDFPIIHFGTRSQYDVEDWLWYIKNCDIIVTHSFHALCFALIFNKPFIVWKIPGFDDNRYTSLLETLGMGNRLLVDIGSLEQHPDIFKPIDWENVNAILAQERERGLVWLRDALEAPKDWSKIKPEQSIIRRLQETLSHTLNVEDYLTLQSYKKTYLKYILYKFLSLTRLGKGLRRRAQKYRKKVEDIRMMRQGIFPI